MTSNIHVSLNPQSETQGKLNIWVIKWDESLNGRKRKIDPKREACVCDLLISEEKERQRGAAIKKDDALKCSSEEGNKQEKPLVTWSQPSERYRRTKNEPNGRGEKKNHIQGQS